MIRRIAPVAFVACALALFVASAPANAAQTIQRTFHYSADAFRVRAQDGVVDVNLPGATREFRAGRPDLPTVIERVEIPEGFRVTGVRVTRLAGSPLASRIQLPSAQVVKPGLQPIERTAPDPRFFNGAGMQPEIPVTIGHQGFQRGRNVTLLQVTPARWDPSSGRLERIDRLDVELVLAPSNDRPLARQRVVPEWEDTRLMRSPGRLFDASTSAKLEKGAGALASSPVFEATQVPSVLGSPVAYLIVTNDALAPEFQRLADWKTQTGVPAVVRTLSTIRQAYPYGVDDADRVRQFIRDAYTRWGTQWVLLGGDVEVIPTRLAATSFYTAEPIACDMYFSCLDGNWNADGDNLIGEGFVDSVEAPGDQADLLPEVYVGRATVVTPEEADRFVDKTLQYTKTPVGDYENTLLYFAEVLFPQIWNPGDFISLDGAQLVEETLPSVKKNPAIRYTRLYENHTDPRWEPGSFHETKQAVVDSMDRGYNVTVHIGHGYRNVMAVGNEQNLDNSDVLGLTNGNRLTNLYSINCTSNAIDFPCIGEAFIHAPNGGAVTNVGSTRLDFPSAGRVFQKEYFRLLYEDSVNAVGEAQALQKLPFVGYSSGDNVNRWMEFTLLLIGDPELRIYTGLPRTLVVTHPATVFSGDSLLPVTVKIGATPLPGARVVAYKAGDEYRIGTTNASGQVTLPFRPDSVGSVTLTVTAYDARPFQVQIPINASVQPVLAERAPVIDDDNSGGTSGNSNGISDSGEILDLRVQVKNNGSVSGSSVTGTLSTSDPYATVTGASVTYGTIAAGATTNVAAAYRVNISSTAPDDREIGFNLRLADGSGRTWNERISFVNHAPILRHYGETVTDNGNANGHPDPGETVTYLMRLKNRGTGIAQSVTAKLRPVSAVTVIDSVATWGTLNPGEEKTADAVVFVPANGTAKLELRVSDSHGLVFTKILDVTTPATPTDLSGLGATSSIALSWTPAPEPDLLGYNVYRANAPGGPFTRLGGMPNERTSYYVDEGLTTLTKYYYQVSAVDSSGNESNRSAVLSVSTNPPTHAFFPTPMAAASKSSVAIEHIWPGFPLDVVTGSGDVLYAWNPDGSAPVDADGSAATSGDFTRRGFNYTAPPSVADLNNDNVMEIVGSSWDSLTTYAFNRDGSIRAGWPITTTDPVWSAAAIADLENDGQKEIVFSSNGFNVYGFRANGTEIRDGDANASTVGVFKRLDTPYNFGSPAIADIDQNGQKEVIIASVNGWVYAMRSNGTSPAGWPVFIGAGSGLVFGSPAIGNLDGTADNEIDIVIPIEKPGGDDSLVVLRANGARKAGWPRPAKVGGLDLQPSPALADVNNDGKLDVVAAGTDGRLYVYSGTGATIAPLNGARFSTLTEGATESSPVVADINGDNWNDVIVGDELGSLTAISGADGTVLAGFPIQLGAEVKGTPAVCDCDGDGLSEIVFSGMDLKAYMWDYDFPFSPNGPAPWPQFRHDAARTGYAGTPMWTGVEDEDGTTAAAVRTVEFAAPTPNPAPRNARFTWAVPGDRAGNPLEVAVFDLSGRRVRIIEKGIAQPGRHGATWDLRSDRGTRVEGGVYFVRYQLGKEIRSQKLVVLQ